MAKAKLIGKLYFIFILFALVLVSQVLIVEAGKCGDYVLDAGEECEKAIISNLFAKGKGLSGVCPGKVGTETCDYATCTVSEVKCTDIDDCKDTDAVGGSNGNDNAAYKVQGIVMTYSQYVGAHSNFGEDSCVNDQTLKEFSCSGLMESEVLCSQVIPGSTCVNGACKVLVEDCQKEGDEDNDGKAECKDPDCFGYNFKSPFTAGEELICDGSDWKKCSKDYKGLVVGKASQQKQFLCYSSPQQETKFVECGLIDFFSQSSGDEKFNFYCQQGKWKKCASETEGTNIKNINGGIVSYCDGNEWTSCSKKSVGIAPNFKYYCIAPEPPIKTGFWEECGGANEGKASPDSKYYCSKGKSVWEKCSSGVSSSLSSDKKAVCKNWKWEGVTMIGGIAPVVAKPKGPVGTGVQPKVSTEQVEAELGQATGGVGEAAPSKPVVDPNGDGKVNNMDLEWIKKNPEKMWQKLNGDIKNWYQMIESMKEKWESK